MYGKDDNHQPRGCRCRRPPRPRGERCARFGQSHEHGSPMNMGLFSVGAQPACMADD